MAGEKIPASLVCSSDFDVGLVGRINPTEQIKDQRVPFFLVRYIKSSFQTSHKKTGGIRYTAVK